MKKGIAMFLALSLLLLSAGCTQTNGSDPAAAPPVEATPPVMQPSPSTETGLLPGVYEASAPGYNGSITVAVTVSADAIEDIRIVETIETAAIGGFALEMLAERVVKYQTVNVDSVSGATASSMGFKRAVSNAIELSGADINNFSKEANVVYEGPAAEDASADVVVVGGGAAGMIAAVKLAREGFHVILVEKRSMLGGTSSRAGAQNFACLSKTQIDTGDYLSLDEFTKKSYISHFMDYEMVKIMAEKSGGIVDWLRFDIGIPLSVPFPGGMSVTVPSQPGQRIGSEITIGLKNELDRLGVDYRLETQATQILLNGDRAAGVAVDAPNGTYNIKANAVVITSGGYSSNPEKIAEYIPRWTGAPSNEVPEATGDGIWMAQDVGASVVGLSDEWVTLYTSSVILAGGESQPVGVRAYGGILVSLDGNRFFDELHLPLVDLAYAAQEQPEGRYFGIVDQDWVDQYGIPKTALPFTSIRELAEHFGINSDNLEKTVTHYNEMFEAGEDTDFQRLTITHDIVTAPFYGVELFSALHGTEGGIEVDNRMQVLRPDGTLFKGLYAGGGVAEDGLAFNPGMSSNLIGGTVIAESIIEDYGW